MRRTFVLCLCLSALALPRCAHSFCGFYVASGEAKLFNHASKVALVRDGDRAVMTMAADVTGDPKQFAIVVPVPTVLERGQVHVGENALIDHLDAFSAPRLVEYHDPDSCPAPVAGGALYFRGGRPNETMLFSDVSAGAGLRSGVVVERQFKVDEYDILILSATESDGLVRWLREHRYTIPAGAEPVVAAYLKQGMKFFVAKVNVAEQARRGLRVLRPLQIAYESPKFMLPVRLGMANADGPQELFVFAITPRGRVEPTNYRSVKLPTDAEIPEYVQGDFGRFYRDAFGHATEQNGMGVVFTEYAWDMSSCDPCASSPLSPDELRALGVWWLDRRGGYRPGGSAFVTRLHARYDRASFPEDLVLQVTDDRANFQGRYVIRHEWKGDCDCEQGRAYRETLRTRRAEQARALVALTGWPLEEVRTKMGTDAEWTVAADRRRWWDGLWGK
jgi:hypothetical protein